MYKSPPKFNNCYNNNTNGASHFVDVHLNTNGNLEQQNRYSCSNVVDGFRHQTTNTPTNKNGGNFEYWQSSSADISHATYLYHTSVNYSAYTNNLRVERYQRCNEKEMLNQIIYQNRQSFSAKADSSTTDHVKRPMNGFMVFSQFRRKELAAINPTMHNAEISKILGYEWKKMEQSEKRLYLLESLSLQKQHSINHPGYKYKPKRRKNNDPMTKRRLGGDKQILDNRPKNTAAESIIAHKMTQVKPNFEEKNETTIVESAETSQKLDSKDPVTRWYSVVRDIYDVDKDEFNQYLPKDA